MAHALYMDHSVNGAIVAGLRRRGVNVLTAQEDDHHEAPDSVVIDRAAELGRVVFAQDVDFLIDSDRRQRLGIHFHGVIYAHQTQVPIGRCIEDLQLLVEAEDIENLVNNVIRLPL